MELVGPLGFSAASDCALGSTVPLGWVGASEQQVHQLSDEAGF